MTLRQNRIAKRKSKGSQLSATTLGLINAIMLAGAAHSQTTNAPAPAATSTNAPAKLPDVVVTGEQEKSYKPENLASPKYTEPLLNVPQTVTVIPQAVIEERNATTLRDVLRNVSGISIQAGEGGVPAGDNLSIRGFNARTDIFVDGVRDFGGYSRDPFNVEQVEVSKGPASSYAGRGSTGGSINLVSKTPRLDSFYGGSLGIGTDEYYRGTVDLNQPIEASPIEGTAFRLNGMYHNAEEPGRDVVENERWGVAPSIVLGLGTPTRTTLSYFHLEQDNMPDYGIPWVAAPNASLPGYIDEVPPVDFSNFYGLKKRDFEETRTDIGTAEIEHDFSESLSLRNLLRYGRSERDSLITAPRFQDIDPGTPGNQFGTVIRRSDLKGRDQINEILANQTDLTVEFETGKIEHEVVTGVEYAYETDVNHTLRKFGTDSPPTDLFNPNPDDPYTENVHRDGDARSDLSADSVALYAFDTVKFSEQWQLNGGVRWDYFDVNLKNIDADGTTTNKLERTDREFTWRLGPVFKPVPNGSIYVAYGTSFNPSAEGLTLSTSQTAANNFNTDPEESRSYELGTKWELFDRKLFLNAAIFRTDKINARTRDSLDNSDIIALDGEQRVDGFELGAAGNITRDWQVSAGYTFLDSEIEKSDTAAEVGKELPGTPRHSFSLWTTYQLPWNLEIGAGAQFVGSRFANTINTRKAPSYWLGEAMLAYQATKNLSVQLNVYNLTDEKYIDAISGGHFIPGAGRSAAVTASFKF
jgi:catecholate siderophore receptor